MKNTIAFPFLPPQRVGEETETSSFVEALDNAQAKEWFEIAVQRLQNVNEWAHYCGFLSSDFLLADESGNPVTGNATEGMYMRINVPGPGTKAGNGFDWIIFESVRHEILSTTQEIFMIQARPSKMPGSTDDNTIAHFLKADATSSFVVILDDNTVTVTVFGRNEVPNTSMDMDILDTIRNTIVGSTGAIGVSKLQWKALVNGILDFAKK